MSAHFTYLCPIRYIDVKPEDIEDLKEYWDKLSGLGGEILVVDGSPTEVFQVHRETWTNCQHIPVDPQYQFMNGKVNGVITGVMAATHEFIILGDDDVRYEAEDIQRMLEGLRDHHMVKPQNYFDPNPFWTQIDSSRILLNRTFFPEGDFPGTLGFRKEVFLKAGVYDGDALFDNEEIVKHLENRGAKILYDRDFFIRREPPTFQKWLEQRPRQAYEDFILRGRTIFFLSLIPTLLLLIAFGKPHTAALLAVAIFLGAILKAEEGRRGAAGKYFPPKISLLAPLWILERSINIYWALYWKIIKGGCPFGDKYIYNGTGRAWTEGRQPPLFKNE